MRKYTEPALTRANTRLLIVILTALLLAVPPVKADDYIIVYRNHLQKQKMLSQPSFTVSRSFHIIPAVAAQLDVNQVKQLRANPDVEYIEPDYKIYALGSPSTPAESSSPSPSDSPSSSQTIPYGITMVNAPAVWSRTKGAGVRVADLDTGISVYHPDRGNVVGSASFVPGEAVEDFDGHGTHTSGIIAAADNNIGVVGVAPEADLLIAKIMDNTGSGQTSWLISGIEWAVDNNAKVISMSLGSYDYSAALDTACSNAFAAGAVLVAAAGNDDVNTPLYPAALSSVISVMAIDQNKNNASFSNYGSTIALAAPGVGVYSTVPVAADPNATADAIWNSTSHQANIVTGTAPGSVTGSICNCGLATDYNSQDTCPNSVAGNIALIRRGTITFAQKVANAQSKGAIGAIIDNNVPRNFYGTLGDGTPLVVVSISQADGDALQTLAQSNITGTVSVDANLYASYDGTSFACPHVAGVAALVFAAGDYNITPTEVSNILFDSAQNLGQPGRDDIFGYGLVNANAALQSICAAPSPPTSVSASDGTYADKVRVTWDSVSGATSYEVWRSTDSSSSSASKLGNYTSPFDDSSVTPGTTYYYWVKARNSCGPSDFSSSDSGYASTSPPSSSVSITKCTVTAGSKVSSDTISISGTMNATADDFNDANVVVTIDSNDMVSPCVKTFPINGKTFKKDKYNCSKTEGTSKTSFTFDTKTSKFSFTAKNVDLSGLSCPLTVQIEIGDYNATVEVDETIVNGKKPIPISLMTGVKDVLRIDVNRLKSDQWSVAGGFAVEDPTVSMANRVSEGFVVTLGTQTFTIPANKLKAGKGKFTCSKVLLSDGSVASANFNFNTCSFTLTIKNTTIMAGSGDVNFGIQFAGFNEDVPVVL
ncbi:MAG: S8 family serine peptidase [Sedimentisphaerales bacterium]|jgi:subtilisin family serine protease